MYRKRVTQLFPFLLPVRGMQRKMCFYAGMRFDGHRYAETIDGKQLPYKLLKRIARYTTAKPALI